MATVKLQLVKEEDELDPLYRIGAEAWKDDPFFNWFFPGGREHFDDAILLWQSALQSYFLDKGKFVLVAVASTGENPSKKVVGFAVWERRGSSEAAKCWQGTTISKSTVSSLMNPCLYLLLMFLGTRRVMISFRNVWRLLFHESKRSISVKRLTQMDSAFEQAEAAQPPESWYLVTMGVDPKAQRMGIGRKLLQWGIDRSEEESIPACLEASQAGLPLYQKMGFKQIAWMDFDDGKQRQPVMRRECSSHFVSFSIAVAAGEPS